MTKLRPAVLLLLSAGFMVAGAEARVGPDQPPAKPPGEKPAGPPAVRLGRPQPGGLERTTRRPCAAEPLAEAAFYPRTAGVVKGLAADLGDRVKQGQVLAEIDAPELVLAERQAAVGVEQAERLLREVQDRVDEAKAEAAVANAAVRQREAAAAKAALTSRKRQLERMKSLVERSAVDSKIADEAEGQYLAASEAVVAKAAAVEHARAAANLEKVKAARAQSSVVTAKVSVGAAKLVLAKSRLALGQTRVVCPYDGVVVRRFVWVGSPVRPCPPDLPAASASPLLTVVRDDVIRVVFEVPDRLVPLVEAGVPADVEFDALPGLKLTGKVSRFATAEDPKTRTMRTEIDIPNPTRKIRPGMPGTAVLKFGKGPAGAVRVPAGAIVPLRKPRADGTANAAVYTYRDGTARLTPVRTGTADGAETEILSGLTSEVRVVLNPKELPTSGGDEIPVRAEK